MGKTEEQVQGAEMTALLTEMEEMKKKLTALEGAEEEKKVGESDTRVEQIQYEKNLHRVMEEAKKDTVTITLPIDMNSENDEVFVGANGYTYLIKRGEPVEVPRFVAEILDKSEKQMVSAVKLMNKLEKDSEEKMRDF